MNKLIDNIWWRWVKGPEISVAWPVGEVRIQQEQSGIWDYVRSADPNDFYRPELEQLVGSQYIDWIWGIRNNDATENKLTIKFRKKHAHWATYFFLKWQ